MSDFNYHGNEYAMNWWKAPSVEDRQMLMYVEYLCNPELEDWGWWLDRFGGPTEVSKAWKRLKENTHPRILDYYCKRASQYEMGMLFH